MRATVDDLAHDGVGIVRVDGEAYFVRGVLPGETIEFTRQKKRRGRRNGALLRVLDASPHRVAPRCEYFGVCGGCAEQHIAASAQIAFKEKTLFDNLARLGGATEMQRLPAVVGSPWHYRRKARLGVRDVPKKGGVLVGFREAHSNLITPLASCQTLHKRLSALLPALAATLQQTECRAQIPQIECAVGDNAAALVVRHLTPLPASDAARLSHFGASHDVQMHVQPGGADSVTPLAPTSPAPLHYRIDRHDLCMRFAPTDFIQINREVNAMMIDRALELLAPRSDDRILDLFCGLGNFTLPIARSGATTLGIEGARELIARAVDNANQNNVAAEFALCDLANESFRPPSTWRTFNKLLLDPPRNGAAQVITQIESFAPQVIVYVSCNPATLARDTAALLRQNYKLTAAGVIDMFPHTAQIEAIARFERGG